MVVTFYMRLLLIGCGNVGKAFVKLLAMKKEYLESNNIDLKLCGILTSKGGLYEPLGLDCHSLYKYLEGQGCLSNHPLYNEEVDISFFIEKGMDAVVLATPTNKDTGEPGIGYIHRSLESGLHVITADKGPVLLAYKELKEIAIKNNVQLGIGCTTGGALPAINAGLIDLAGADIYKIQGVLNGTTNFIIDEMEENSLSYEEALKKAQNLGIAETNPALDVEGWDTATKLLILSNVLMRSNKTLKDIKVEGITRLTVNELQEARNEGRKYKLIGTALKKHTSVEISVKLEQIDDSSEFYPVSGKNKAVKYYSDTLGELTVIGGASGVIPAAASLLRDILNICTK
jgi:homoserine dehydrogenase